MSGNDNNDPGGGRSLGGGPAEPMPSSWSRPAAPRVGRIGEWNNSSSSGYRVFLVITKISLKGSIEIKVEVGRGALLRSPVLVEEEEGTALLQKKMTTTTRMRIEVVRAGLLVEREGVALCTSNLVLC